MSTPSSASPDSLGARLQDVLSRGDLEDFGRIFRTYYRSLCRYAYPLVQSREDADDIVQGVFASLWCSRETLRIETGSIASYLFPAVRNRCFDFLRKRQAETRINTSAEMSDAPAVVPRDVVADATVREVELRGRIMAAIAQLPGRRRQTFELRYLHGLPEREVAEAMQVGVNTVHTHARLALAALRERLSEYRDNA